MYCAKLSLLLFICSFTLIKSYAGRIRITLEVDRTQISTSEQITAQVSVEGSDDIKSFPEIVGGQNFEIQSGGTTQQLQIINNQTSRTNIFQYYLFPKREGVFTLGPAKAIVNGSVHLSDSVVIKVSKEDQVPQTEKNSFLQASVDNLKPYVGQQVVYTFRFFTKVQFNNANLDFPNFDGFWKETLGKQIQYEKIIQGTRFVVTEIKYALFPLTPGETFIEPVKMSVELLLHSRERNRRHGSMFDDFFSNSFFRGGGRTLKRVRLSSDKIKMKIRPLPENGKPNNFSGLVGNFSFEADISKNVMKVGDSATLNLAIRGDGNFRDIKFPEISWKDFKIYNDKPSLKVSSGHRLQGQKIIKKAIVPMKEGDYDFKINFFNYFDPQSGKYNMDQIKKIHIKVLPGNEKGKYTSHSDQLKKSQKKEIKILGKDLMPLMRGTKVLENDKITHFQKILLNILNVIFPLLFFFIVIYRKRRERIEKDYYQILKAKAHSTFNTKIKKLDMNGLDFFANISQIFREYLGHRFVLEGMAISAVDIERILSPYKLSPPLTEEIKKHLKTFEMGQYGGNSYQLQDKKEMVNLLAHLVKKIEKEVKL